ncbi:MAG: cytochrome b5-like heme/steroid binding domain-containing protein, partial [Candidatus Pacearchaeota archaeon]
ILPENTNRQTILESTNQNMGGIEKITFKEVSKHNSPEDCWIIINQKVYDITNFIALGEHPPQIELGCGKDSTKLFETRTTETGEKIGSGTPHSENARKLLERYYIGDLQ